MGMAFKIGAVVIGILAIIVIAILIISKEIGAYIKDVKGDEEF